MTFLSLFSGIGGLDLGLERAGMRCVGQVEIDPYCQRVLAKHWPDLRRHDDIRTFPTEPLDQWRSDLICGGFPCQPVSLAGKRRAQADDRWLWPEFARVIRVLRPRYVLLENVPGLLVRGFGDVLGDLAALGLDADWGCIPAAAVGAPHLRWRVFIVAYTRRINGDGWPHLQAQHSKSHRKGSANRTEEKRSVKCGREVVANTLRQQSERRGAAGDLAGESGDVEGEAYQRERRGDASGDRDTTLADAEIDGRIARRQSDATEKPGGRDADRGDVGADVSDPECNGLERAEYAKRGQGTSRMRRRLAYGNSADVPDSASSECAASTSRESPQSGDWWAIEPDVGRVADGVPARVDRLRALGNAVVPQVAELVGRMILESDS